MGETNKGYVEIPTWEYESLIKDQERLLIVERIVIKEKYPSDTLKLILGIEEEEKE